MTTATYERVSTPHFFFLLEELKQNPISKWKDIIPEYNNVTAQVVNWAMVCDAMIEAQEYQYNKYLEEGYPPREATFMTHFSIIPMVLD